jgi:voltage-gated potassium channel
MPNQNTVLRAQSYIRRLRLALLLVAVGIAVGIVGFVTIEDYPFVDAFYMTVITLATVGFTEVHPLSEAGRVFTSILILSNLGIFAFAVSTITNFFIEGDVKVLMRQYRAMKQIDQLQGHVIVCGYGRIGRQVVQELRDEGRSFLLVENVVPGDSLSAEDLLVLQGDATQEQTLEEAGIHRAVALITTLPKDADNLFVVLTARGMKPDLKIISRASQASSMPKLRQAGADYVIMPERMGGTHMAALVTKPDIVQFIELLNTTAGQSIALAEYPVGELRADWQGRALGSLDAREQTGVNLIGLKVADGRFVVNPSLTTLLSVDQTLIVLGTDQQIEQFDALAHADN